MDEPPAEATFLPSLPRLIDEVPLGDEKAAAKRNERTTGVICPGDESTACHYLLMASDCEFRQRDGFAVNYSVIYWDNFSISVVQRNDDRCH